MQEGTFNPPPPHSSLPPLSNPITVHYSFDMAQQVRVDVSLIQSVLIFYVSCRYITPLTHNSQGLCTSSPQESVQCLGYAVREYHVRYVLNYTQHGAQSHTSLSPPSLISLHSSFPSIPFSLPFLSSFLDNITSTDQLLD